MDGDANNWFIFEEGGYPKEIGGLLQLLNPKNRIFKGAELLSESEIENLLRDAGAGKSGTVSPETDRSAICLAMGRDRANGRIALHPRTHNLEIDRDLPLNLPLYHAEDRFVSDLAKAMGGDAAVNPFWRLLHLPVSVHNLGGCPIADSSAHGVSDGYGEVFRYPGLFVLDGAALPAAMGANPSHTIAAVAERNIEAAIRRFTGNKDWRAPEAAAARPLIEPLSGVVVQPKALHQLRCSRLGLHSPKR
jgi:cholesterol oxidase